MGRDAWYWKHTKERGRGEGKESWKEKKQKCGERNTALNEPQTRVPFILRTLNTFMKLPEIFPLVKWETSTKLCLTLGTLWTIAARLLCPRDFPGKNTGVGCHFLFQGIFPNPGINLTSPALAKGFFTAEPPGKPREDHHIKEVH